MTITAGSPSIAKYTHEPHGYLTFFSCELYHLSMVQQVEHPSLPPVHLGSDPEVSNPTPSPASPALLLELPNNSAAHPWFLLSVL